MSETPGRVVLDTCVLIHLIRGNDLGRKIDAHFGLTRGKATALISAVTLGEGRSLALQWGWGTDKVQRMEKLFRELIVMEVNLTPVLERYALLDMHSRDRGRKMGKNDLWIVATAAATSSTLVSTDRDFDHIDPAIVSHVWIDPA